jgi:photosystem II stability/assembly factor-like uncharacterized protein
LIAASLTALVAASASYIGPQKTAPPEPATPSVAPPGLQPVSEDAAWLALYQADTDRAFELFKTLDGGRSWLRMLSAGSDRPLSWMHFFDARRGLVLAGTRGNRSQASLLYETADGGSHWRTNELPVEGGLTDRPVRQWLSFSDLEYGWYLAGIGNESAAVYRTTDAGVSWTEVARVDEIQTVSHGLLLHGRKSGIRFVNRREGWIGFEGPGPPSVYHSVDGGQTWALQPVPQAPIPPDEYRAQELVAPPSVFGPVAVLVVTGVESYALVSGDQGRTWSDPRLLPESLCCPSVLDALHWWVADGNRLWSTTDAGRSWRLGAARVPAGVSLTAVVPASLSRAWGLGSRAGALGASVVLRSSDSGVSWSPVTLPSL